MKEKYPYLSELDDLDALTHLDVEAAEPAAPEESVSKTTQEEPPVGEFLNLAPDIPVTLVAVMDRKSVTVKDLLGLRMGSVVVFDRTPAEPVDVLAGGKLFAKGELVEVDGKLGIRILKLIK